MKIHLYINFYLSDNKERNEENQFCVMKNALLKDVDQIHVVVDDKQDYEWLKKIYGDKLCVHVQAQRPTFRDFFDVANQHTSEDNCINIIANTDIEFTPSLQKLKHFSWENDVFCITRNDVTDNAPNSQDAWVWKGKINMLPHHGKFYLGKAYCDNAIAHQFKEAGYQIANPRNDIELIHHHKSDYRTWSWDKNDIVAPPYQQVLPCDLPHRVYWGYYFMVMVIVVVCIWIFLVNIVE